jgi:molybdopterin-synthase adenylyltransferase
MAYYDDLISRNNGYISVKTQNLISETRLLVAGCGIGSQAAEAACRVGFRNFTLVDNDTISSHNLNRQFFFHDQVGKLKVDALKENLLRINPSANIHTRSELLSKSNAAELVEKSDLVLDTIDFLDLQGIVALHDEAFHQKKNLVSSFSVGFGAAVISIPASNEKCSAIRTIFGLPESGDLSKISYVEKFKKIFVALAPKLDPTVLTAMQRVFSELEDGRTCPAPQVSPGAHAVAAACVTAAIRMLEGKEMTLAPEMVVVNLIELLSSPGISLI